MKNPFLEGDIIRCAEPRNSNILTEGREYTVLSISAPFVVIISDDGEKGGWDWKRFTLVERICPTKYTDWL
jgi:hypothetical protein